MAQGCEALTLSQLQVQGKVQPIFYYCIIVKLMRARKIQMNKIEFSKKKSGGSEIKPK